MIVIGTNHHNTLGIIRSLGQKNIYPDVILYGNDVADGFVVHSKYIRACHCFETAEEAIKELSKLCTNGNINEKRRICVITCSDEVASILDYQYEEWKERLSFFNCGEKGLLTYYMDKQVQVEIAKEVGISVPASQTHRIGEELLDKVMLPCIVKPLESIHGGKKISVCDDLESVINVLNTYNEGDVVQIQQYIQGDYEIVVDGLALEADIIIPGYIKKFRNIKGGTTYSESYPLTYLPTAVIKSIKAMLRKMHYYGLFGVELIVSKGIYYFIEVNLRNDATTYTLSKAGINLPYIYYMSTYGADYSNELNVIRNIRSMVEYRDLDFVFSRKISYRQWLKEKRNCDCLYFADSEDSLPETIARKHYLKSKISSVLCKLHLTK